MLCGRYLSQQRSEELTLLADDNKVNQRSAEGAETVTEMSLQAPASNPGSDDPSAGIATGNGGVSSAAYVLSPVPNEQKSVVQATVDTVKAYLPSLGSLKIGRAHV